MVVVTVVGGGTGGTGGSSGGSRGSGGGTAWAKQAGDQVEEEKRSSSKGKQPSHEIAGVLIPHHCKIRPPSHPQPPKQLATQLPARRPETG